MSPNIIFSFQGPPLPPQMIALSWLILWSGKPDHGLDSRLLNQNGLDLVLFLSKRSGFCNKTGKKMIKLAKSSPGQAMKAQLTNVW